jgi:AmmeMemoRadiSam system protein A
MRTPSSPSTLDVASRRWLLRRARDAIAGYFARRPLHMPADMPDGTDNLRGCFVSIHTRHGDLRGCVGTFEAEQPLWRHVEDMAVAAATRDPRFVPLQAEELDGCVLEVSALTPRQPATPTSIQVGTHGLWIQRGAYRGVLLPQVASTYGWDRETFLQQTCIKAGLTADAWRQEGVQISTFTAEVFTESERLT